MLLSTPVTRPGEFGIYSTRSANAAAAAAAVLLHPLYGRER